MHMKVSIAGASGYAGGELIRLLISHPHYEITSLCAQSNAGQRLSDVHPQFRGTSIANHILQETTANNLQADLVFLALPHGTSGKLAKEILSAAPSTMIVDLGADHRLVSPDAWGRYYGSTQAGTWVYGLPELPGQADLIAQAKQVANPGCYATAVALGFMPAIASSLIAPNTLTVVAASGTSGAGKTLAEYLLATNVMGSMSAYKVGGIHQHIPEIEQTINSISQDNTTKLSFTPLLAPMPRGIIAICTAQMKTTMSSDQVRQRYQEIFADKEFVTVLEDGDLPGTGSVSGSNSVHISVHVDSHSDQLVAVSVLDNLVKGAAGQAIQNANIMCGLPEGTGLSQVGVSP